MARLISEIWVFTDDADRDAIGTNDGLKVEDRGWNQARDQWEVCIQAFPTSSTWTPIGGISTLPPTNQDCYHGFSKTSPCFFKTVWTAVHTQFTTIVDQITNNITRVDSTFTVTRAGLYVFLADSTLRVFDRHFALRWRSLTNGTVIQQAGYYGSLPTQTGPYSSSNRGTHGMNGIVEVSAGEEFILEYVLRNSGASATWNGDTLDGEVTTTLNVSIFSVGGTFVLIPTGTKTNNYIAKQSDNVLCNPSGGGFTVTFPATPTQGGTLSIKNVSTSTNTILLDGNGKNIEEPVAGFIKSATVSLSTAGFAGNWQYDGADWLLMSTK